MIIGRDFLNDQSIEVVYKPDKNKVEEGREDFPAELLQIGVMEAAENSFLDEIETDFNAEVTGELKKMLVDIEQSPTSIVADEYFCNCKTKRRLDIRVRA